jgi:hypothetical protein
LAGLSWRLAAFSLTVLAEADELDGDSRTMLSGELGCGAASGEWGWPVSEAASFWSRFYETVSAENLRMKTNSVKFKFPIARNPLWF